MTWGRLALIHAAGESEKTLQAVAQILGYEQEPHHEPDFPPDLIHENPDNSSASKSTSTPTTDASKPAARPSARFLRVNKREQLTDSDRSDNNQRGYLRDPGLRLTAESAPKGTYLFAAPEPLMAMPRLLPFLHNALGRPRQACRIDYPRLTRLLANIQPIRRLPQLTRLRWPQRLQIIVDTRVALEPYWSDFSEIIAQLKKLLGKEAVTSLRFDEETFGKNPSYTIAWPTHFHDDWFTWRIPASDQAILILSDLGSGAAQPEARFRWQQLIQRLQAHPAPILALSPVSHSPQSKMLCRTVKPSPLNDSFSLPRHPSHRGFRLPSPDAEKITDILALLSPLPLIDKGLLRLLRKQLHWGSSELETLIWNHADMRQTSLGIYLHEAAAKNYQQLYRQKFTHTPQSARMWDIVHSHHQHAFEGLRQLENLNRCVLENSGDIDSVRHYFQRLAATMRQDSTNAAQEEALLMQCRTILNYLPDPVWHSKLDDLAYDLYAMAHQDDIRAGRWPDKLKPGFDPNRLLWVLDQNQQTDHAPWQIQQTGSQGEFICQHQAQSTHVAPPIAQFDAHPAFPPTYRLPAQINQNSSMIRTGQTYNPNNNIIAIQTIWERLELEAIDKPAWATDIWCNSEGLSVKLPTWRGVTYTAKWFTGEAGRTGTWLIPFPFGIDQYGLYAHLHILPPQITELSSSEEIITQCFRWITPGTFLMGSPESELERSDNETQHEVTLTNGFWLADSTCTQALWTAVMGNNPSRFQGDPNHPVENISWNEVQQFIEKLNTLFPDLHANLPTEAQWEYACRAGTQTPFSFGENITPEQVNYDGNYPYAGGKKGLFREKTVPVKLLPPNP